MTARASQPRMGVVYVQYDRSKYVRSLPRLVELLGTLDAGDAPVVVVDNAAEGDWCHRVSQTIVHLGGENSAWEFSAFDRGLEWLAREIPGIEVYLLVTDALLAYGEDYLDLLDREAADRKLLTSSCLGWMDSFCQPCRILDYEYDTWMRTSLLFMPAAAVGGVGPLAWPLDDAGIFGDSSRQPFRPDAPLSPELRRLLLDWLTIDPGDDPRERGGWHSRFVLDDETFGFFRSKVKSILREHLLSARLRSLGVPCFDFRAARTALDAGLRLAGLDAEESRRWQWLHWFGGAAPAAGPGPVLVLDAGSVRGSTDETVEFLGREVMPLILQRHAAARLVVRGAEPPPSLHSLADPTSVTAAGDGSAGLAGAAALLLPGPLSDAAADRLAEAAAEGVPAVGTAALEAVAGGHFLRAETSWELAEACCRLIEEPALGSALAAGARERLAISANAQGASATAAGSPAAPAPPPAPPPAEGADEPARVAALRPAFPDGHFYSPVVDPTELREREEAIWPQEAADNPAVDFRAEAQRELLTAMARYAGEFDYPEERPDAARGGFVERNGKFEGLDARMLFCLLRHLRPRRMIEVGSGFSSLLAADVNRRFLAGSVEIVCVEPFPPPFLEQPVEGLTELIEQKVQDVSIAVFQRLGEGDVLFIDSSHVAKTGSDVNALYFRILPALQPGVVLHLHDVFFPDDYPREWVLGEQRSWNEQYIVHALLTYSHGLEVLFGSAYAARRFPELVRQVFGIDCGGGSLWLRKTVARR